MHFQRLLALAVPMTAILVADAAPLPVDPGLEERQILGLSLPIALTLDLPALGLPLPTGLIPDLPALTDILPALPLPTGLIPGLPALTDILPALPLPTGILPFKEGAAPPALEERQLDTLAPILGALPSVLPLPLPLPTGVVPAPSAPAPTATPPAAGEITDVVSSLLSVLVPLLTNVNVGGALPTPPAVTGVVDLPSVTLGLPELPIVEPILGTLLPGLGL